ncbi:RNA polymerase Rpc34-like protein [Dioscorea alata]|uniref:RNA polymerase Rpc34-like protein n=1 Tax=Dioscorea alata TaxID=55571 RepID=A0ACB7U9Z6_DIOAL|nr:RNA polymerase Rpc34-like protein [Dioscorea alata]
MASKSKSKSAAAAAAAAATTTGLALPQKRSQPPGLNENEKKIYMLIKNREGMGISQPDIRSAINLDIRTLYKALESLQAKQLIKTVNSARNKRAKIYMDFQCQPSAELSGGHWFTNGEFDEGLVAAVRQSCLTLIKTLGVATVDDLISSINKCNIFVGGITEAQIDDILQSLKVDGVVEELKSSGVGDFSRVPVGKLCYRILPDKKEPLTGVMASIPCGVCPRISECTPDGIISPDNCVYYQAWLGF